MSMTLDSTGRSSTERGDTWRNPDSGVVRGILRHKADQDQAGGGIELSCNQFQDGASSRWSQGPPGTSGGRAVDQPCESRRGCHAWVVRAAASTAVRSQHRAGGLMGAGIAPPLPQLGTKGNSGIIKGGCAEHKFQRLDQLGVVLDQRLPSGPRVPYSLNGERWLSKALDSPIDGRTRESGNTGDAGNTSSSQLLCIEGSDKVLLPLIQVRKQQAVFLLEFFCCAHTK